MKMEKNKENYTVYIHNFPNGKSYVGITGQLPEKRWKNGWGYKHQPYLFQAIQKYGWDNIEHFIFASNLTKEEAENMEQILISKLNTLDEKYGYNIAIGGYLNCQYSYKEIVDLWLSGKNENEISNLLGCSLPTISAALNAYKIPMSLRKAQGGLANGKKIGQYDINDNLICVYCSASEAARSLGTYQGNISSCCRGERKTANGYKWRYL